MIKKCSTFSDRAGNLELIPNQIMQIYGFDFEKSSALPSYFF